MFFLGLEKEPLSIHEIHSRYQNRDDAILW